MKQQDFEHSGAGPLPFCLLERQTMVGVRSDLRNSFHYSGIVSCEKITGECDVHVLARCPFLNAALKLRHPLATMMVCEKVNIPLCKPVQ